MIYQANLTELANFSDVTAEFYDFYKDFGVFEGYFHYTKYLDKGYLKAFNMEDELASLIGEVPVFNKVGIATKTRNGLTKHRMIPDTDQSGVRDASVKDQRVIRPRLLDADWRIRELMASGCSGIDLMVLGVSDAFWQAPLHRGDLR